MDIKALAKEAEAYIIDRRRHFHQNPELSFKEWETTKTIVAELEAMGLPVQTFPDYPGCIATLDTGKPGRTLMIRADIDALPVFEKTGLPFASQNEGVMHACGHDTHIAMGLGAAKILTSIKDELPGGRVKFLFQSGEEMGCGAQYYVDHGCLDDVDGVFGMHIWATLDSPYISVEPGNRMASMSNFTINVKGYQSHGSAPQDGHDAIVAASAIVIALQTYVSRLNNPINPLVLSIGKFHGGAMYNIICPDVELVGTIRTYSKTLRASMEDDLNNIIQSTAKAHGCTATLDLKHMLPAVINEDEEMCTLAHNAGLKLFGEEGLGHMDALMGSEDYSLFMDKVPGFFAFIGTKNVEEGIIYPNHNEKYTSDEAQLYKGSALSAQFALDYLNNK